MSAFSQKTSVRRLVGLTALSLLASTAARAQSVGIGTAAPDPAAALDIRTITQSQGLLLPRLTEAQRRDLALVQDFVGRSQAGTLPNGLLVTQTDGARPGLWYFQSGTYPAQDPGNPSYDPDYGWHYLPDLGTVAAAQPPLNAFNGLSKNGPDLRLGGALTQGQTDLGLGTNALTLTGPTLAPAAATTALAPTALDRLRDVSNNNNFPSLPFERRQTFTAPAGANVRLGSVEALLEMGNGAPLTLELLTANGTLVGSASLTTPFTGAVAPPVRWVRFSMNNVSLTSGDTYTLALRQTADTSPPAKWGRAANSYAGGAAGGNPTDDYLFRVFISDDVAVEQARFDGSGLRLAALVGSGSRLVTADADGRLGAAPLTSLADNLGNHLATQRLALADNALLLRGPADLNHGLVYSAAPDGPRLFGVGGGQLGSGTLGGTGSTALRWDNAGRVRLGDGTAPGTAFTLDVNGPVGVRGSAALELGAGLTKGPNAGRLGYNLFNFGNLDIVGAGGAANGSDRKIKLWAEGGLTVAGLERATAGPSRVMTADFNGGVSANGYRGNFVVGANPGSGYVLVTVQLPDLPTPAFAAPPSQVFVTIRTEAGQSYSDVFATTVQDVQARSFKVGVRRVDAGGGWSQNLTLDWLAFP